VWRGRRGPCNGVRNVAVRGRQTASTVIISNEARNLLLSPVSTIHPERSECFAKRSTHEVEGQDSKHVHPTMLFLPTCAIVSL
jgi:hypothetical protein